MRLALVAALALALSACGLTPQGNAGREFVQEKGAQINDAGLANGIWFICNGASVGSVRRRFGRTQSDAETYRALCEGDNQTNLFEPTNEETASQ